MPDEAPRPVEEGTDALIERARRAGHAAFGVDFVPTIAAVAPGRLELLGNHVDYNGGPVLAAAVDRVVVVAADEGDDTKEVQAVAADVSAVPFAVTIEEARGWQSRGGEPDPPAYLRGVVAALLARDHGVQRGRRLAITGSVPLGFGMSSSAALCVALVNTLAGGRLSPHDLVLTAQAAEHAAGTPCGTMDQSASVAGDVIAYNGADDSYTQLRPDLGPYVFAVADSGVTRSLGTSSYPTRVEESKRAVELLRRHLDPTLSTLAQIDDNQWRAIDQHGDAWLPAPISARVRHVGTEVQRVGAGIDAVERSDWARFGRLMVESGRSSAVDYEISHPRVEELVGELNAVDGVLGARMMGGGEGGPALVLLARDALPEAERALRQGYYRRHGMTDRDDLFQACRFGPGAKVTDLPR